MKASNKRTGGYTTIRKRLPKAAIDKSRRISKDAALEMMFSIMRNLLEAQHQANSGKRDGNKHKIAMQKLLQFVKRKVKGTTKQPESLHDSRRRKANRS